MRRLTACLFATLATGSVAHADEAVVASTTSADAGPAPATPGSPVPIEIGVYSGAFLSTSHHQFYNFGLFPGQIGNTDGLPVREDLKKVSPLLGLRLAYFPLSWLGIEGEGNLILESTKNTGKSAKIWGGRLQVMVQAPHLFKHVIPYVALGDGFDHIASPDTVLGSDTDWAPHIGVGARVLVHRSITVRIDARYLRAPSIEAPYTLNASLGEIMLGVSWHPSNKPVAAPPPPRPPDIDSDGDGILDSKDKCPREPEDKDLFNDDDGCPDPDNDNDGIPDGADQCPMEAEDKDGFGDEDGCVDPDNDADGVNDKQDKCPSETEDRDGYKDADGCPDLDNDSDGLSDAQDKCPNEPETINGVDDDDGCPDKGNALVVVSPDRLELLESIIFKKGAIQLKESESLLKQIGANLRAHPEILRLRITVYVNPSKDPDADKRLSESRAFAIREWLIKYGIDEKRLDPRGFGGQSPLVDPKTKNAAAINDRVDLVILERK